MLEKQRFNSEVKEKLKSYVYALVDPTKTGLKQYFYIGKGMNDRCFAHAHNAKQLEKRPREDLKRDTIRRIRKQTKNDPPIIVLAHGMSSKDALQLEAILIKLTKTQTNRVLGHRSHQFCLDPREVEATLGYARCVLDFGHNTLFVNLRGGGNLEPYPLIKSNRKRLAQRTLGDWKIVKNAHRVERIVGCYEGVVRTVFKVAQSDQGAKYKLLVDAEGKQRTRFTGRRDLESEEIWLGRRLLFENGQNFKFPSGSPWRFF